MNSLSWRNQVLEQMAKLSINHVVRKRQHRFQAKLIETKARPVGQRMLGQTAATRMFLRSVEMSKAKREHQRWRSELAKKEAADQESQRQKDFQGCYTKYDKARRQLMLDRLDSEPEQPNYVHLSKLIRALAGINPVRNQNRDMVLKDLIESLHGKAGLRQCSPDGFDDAVKAFEEDR